MPERIQLSRAKGWRMPPNTAKVDRATPWGNPYVAGKNYHAAEFGGDPMSFPMIRDAAHAVELFRASVTAPDADFYRADVRAHLGGKNLACWCKLPRPGEPDVCHAAVLLELANK